MRVVNKVDAEIVCVSAHAVVEHVMHSILRFVVGCCACPSVLAVIGGCSGEPNNLDAGRGVILLWTPLRSSFSSFELPHIIYMCF